MIVKSKKTGIEQEMSVDDWANCYKLGLQRNFIVIDSGQSVTKKELDFPETLEIEELKVAEKPISKRKKI